MSLKNECKGTANEWNCQTKCSKMHNNMDLAILFLSLRGYNFDNFLLFLVEIEKPYDKRERRMKRQK